jgi:hypothetical protein
LAGVHAEGGGLLVEVAGHGQYDEEHEHGTP